MGRFVTEHKFQIVGGLSGDELAAISRMFLRASDDAPRGFRWLRAYVTEEGVLSDCIAMDGDQAREQAERITSCDVIEVLEVAAVIGPDITEVQATQEIHQ